MKTTLLIIAIMGCFALGIVDVLQSAKLKDQRHQLEAIKQENQKISDQLEKQSEAIENVKKVEAKAQTLQKTLHESATATVAESKKVEKLQASLDQARTNNPFHAVMDMMNDPELHKILEEQQKITAGPTIEKEYADLFRQLNLPPEQSAAFKDLMIKKAMVGTDVGLAMMDDSLDPTKRGDLTNQIQAQTDAVDTEIKQLLGESNYQAYQNFEKTMTDRATVGEFNDQFVGSSAALTPEQQNQMVQALSEVRSNFKWSTGTSPQNASLESSLEGALTDESIAASAAESEQFDQQCLARVQRIHTSEQYAEYQKYQKQQRDLQLIGMNLAKQMFNSKSQ